MELLIVRHGEVQGGSGLTVGNHDTPLTHNGMRHAAATAGWLDYKFKSGGYRGSSSPGMACLQTASAIQTVTGVPFGVDVSLRDYRLHEPDHGSFDIENRSLTFQNLDWPPADWPDARRSFDRQSPDDFVNRINSFLYNIESSGYDKFVVVTHAVPAVVLWQLSVGTSPAQLAEKLAVPNTSPDVSPPVLDSLLTSIERQMFVSGTRSCGMTYVIGGQTLWHSKIVYE